MSVTKRLIMATAVSFIALSGASITLASTATAAPAPCVPLYPATPSTGDSGDMPTDPGTTAMPCKTETPTPPPPAPKPPVKKPPVEPTKPAPKPPAEKPPVEKPRPIETPKPSVKTNTVTTTKKANPVVTHPTAKQPAKKAAAKVKKKAATVCTPAPAKAKVQAAPVVAAPAAPQDANLCDSPAFPWLALAAGAVLALVGRRIVAALATRFKEARAAKQAQAEQDAAEGSEAETVPQNAAS